MKGRAVDTGKPHSYSSKTTSKIAKETLAIVKRETAPKVEKQKK